jgi:hypothetical protein
VLFKGHVSLSEVRTLVLAFSGYIGQLWVPSHFLVEAIFRRLDLLRVKIQDLTMVVRLSISMTVFLYCYLLRGVILKKLFQI